VTSELIALIIKVAGELNDQEEIELSDRLEPNTRLFGRDGLLDSMGLVALVIAVEQAIEEKYSVTVALADERALSQSKSPYRTVSSLAEYAAQQVERSRVDA
jgi:acyl carrier protein